MKEEGISRFIERNLKNFSVNSTGWNDLIGEMLAELVHAGWNIDHDVFGKEESGELRCAIYSELEELNIAFKKITNTYLNLSREVCEICGHEGKTRTTGSWRTTLCMNHYFDQKPVMEIDEKLNVSYNNKIILNVNEVVKAEVGFDLHQLFLYTKEYAHENDLFSFSWQEPNYYLLLKIIPRHVFPEDMQRSISDLFLNLKDCEICGNKALHHTSCLRCHHEPWGAYPYHIEDYSGKSDYIKECQIDLFIDEDDHEKLFTCDRSFEKVHNHRILFIPADVDEYKKLLF